MVRTPSRRSIPRHRTFPAFVATLYVSVACASAAGEAGSATPPSSKLELRAAASALVDELAAERHAGVTSFLLEVDGERLADYVAPRLEKRAPDLRSATKSISWLTRAQRGSTPARSVATPNSRPPSIYGAPTPRL